VVKLSAVGRAGFEARVRDLIGGDALLAALTEPVLRARAALWSEYSKLHALLVRTVGRDDPFGNPLIQPFEFCSSVVPSRNLALSMATLNNTLLIRIVKSPPNISILSHCSSFSQNKLPLITSSPYSAIVELQ
jgi:hypothetical protein